jgi:hypothetical protein
MSIKVITAIAASGIHSLNVVPFPGFNKGALGETLSNMVNCVREILTLVHKSQHKQSLGNLMYIVKSAVHGRQDLMPSMGDIVDKLYDRKEVEKACYSFGRIFCLKTFLSEESCKKTAYPSDRAFFYKHSYQKKDTKIL